MSTFPPDPPRPDDEPPPLTEADLEQFMAELGTTSESDAPAAPGAPAVPVYGQPGQPLDPDEGPDVDAAPGSGPEPDRIAFVLTPVASAKMLASLLSIAGIEIDVVPTASGAVVARELPRRDPATDWDIGELLGDVLAEEADASDAGADDEVRGALGGSVPPEAAELAAELSVMIRHAVVLVVADLATDVGIESGISGHITARRFDGGKPVGDVPPGLLLAGADDVVEALVLGRVRPTDVPGAMNSGDIPAGGAKRLFDRFRRPRRAEE